MSAIETHVHSFREVCYVYVLPLANEIISFRS